MPKTSGAVLDWVPQKAAQQMQSDATTRFMPILDAFPFVGQRNAHARLSAQARATSSIYSRDAVKFVRTAKTRCAMPARGGLRRR
jgi:hypothetical protein